MPCFQPIEGWRGRHLNPATGKRPVVFNPNLGYVDMPVTLPCGQCVGCRLERSRQWAVRCHHEASLYEDNCFITLTYRDADLPEHREKDCPPGSLYFPDFQKFMKRLRKQYGRGIRFFHCGEYGEKHGRPHYHAILFNHNFGDRKLWKIVNENPLYTSEELSALWPYGFSSVGAASFQSAAYVARYILKKITGKNAERHYETQHPQTGEILQKAPEYITMSRRPGIGTGWLKKFKTDVYPDDFVVIEGKKMRPPKFYDAILEIEDEATYQNIKNRRAIEGRGHADNNTRDRLKVREQCQEARLTHLPRKLE